MTGSVWQEVVEARTKAMQPWKLIERVATPEGSLDLRQRGERTFLITIGGRVLMTSEAYRSEVDLARRACEAMAKVARPRVMIGGLGMGFTLRAALDHLPPAAQVTVVDLNATVVKWVEGPLAVLTNDALSDKRVKTKVADVARVIADAPPGSYDAIVLDLYEGPHYANNRAYDPLYGGPALERTVKALTPDGVFAVWSEEVDAAFEERMSSVFLLERHKGPKGGRQHIIYVGRPAPVRFRRRS
jgi:spermidine synthase